MYNKENKYPSKDVLVHSCIFSLLSSRSRNGQFSQPFRSNCAHVFIKEQNKHARNCLRSAGTIDCNASSAAVATRENKRVSNSHCNNTNLPIASQPFLARGVFEEASNAPRHNKPVCSFVYVSPASYTSRQSQLQWGYEYPDKTTSC